MKKNKKRSFIIGTVLALAAAGVLAACNREETKYTVSFITNGGSACQEVTVEWGNTFDIPTTTKEGYTFTNWYTNAELTNVYNAGVVEQNIKLYAGWQINQYTVTFNTGENGPVVEPITDDYHKEIAPASPVKDYCNFGGWYTDENCTKVFDNVIPSKDITVYAKWIANTVTVRFDKNDTNAKGTMSSVQYTEFNGKKVLPENKFTKTGYEFKGWATSAKGEVVYLDKAEYSGSASKTEQNTFVTLYAIWAPMKYEVNFYATNNENNLVLFGTPVEEAYDSKVVAPDQTPTKLGYEFKGWGEMVATKDETPLVQKEYFLRDGESENFIKKTDLSYSEAYQGPTLYEVSTENFSKKVVGLTNNYFARFEAKKTSVKFVSSLDDTKVYATKSGYYFTYVGGVDNPTEEHYQFAGWFSEKACNTQVSVNTLRFGDQDIVLYAKFVLNTHKITYMKDGNVLDTQNNIGYGTTLNLLVAPSQEGNTFDGWYLDAELTQKFSDTNMPDNDLTLYAKYTKNQYVVTVNGAGNAYTINVTYGDSVKSQLTDPEKTGYTFSGWYLDEQFANVLTEQYKMPANAINVYAKWNVIESTITYDTNGGTPNSINSTKLAYGETFEGKLPDVTKPGYNFVGWFNRETKVEATTVMGVGDVNLIAKFTEANVKVTIEHYSTPIGGEEYNLKIAENIEDEALTSSTYTVTSQDAKQIEGFTFKEAETKTVSADGSTVIKVLYTRNNYTVTFVDASDSKKLSSDYPVSVAYNGKLSVIPEEVKGVKQVIITYKDHATDTEVDPLDLVITGNTQIDVYYEDFPGLQINANGGKFSDGSTVITSLVEADTQVVLPAENPTREGYNFLGYRDSEEQDIADSFMMKEGGMIIVAEWEKCSYTISFDTGDEDVTVDPITSEFESTVTLPTEVSRVGYTFKGWYLSTDDNKVITAAHTLGSKDVEFVASWAENAITVAFNGNGADAGSMENVVIKFTERASTVLPECSFSKTGYSFQGWALTNASDGEIAISKDDIATFAFEASDFDAESKTVTYYAVWTVNKYSLSFDTDGGNTIAAVDYDYGASLVAPQAPTKTGYTFKGWQLKSGETYVDFDFTNKTMGAADMQLKAKWEVNKHSIIYNSNGGSTVTDSATYAYGSSLSDIAQVSDPTKEGYEFKGWFTANGTYAADHSANNDWGSKVDDTYLASATMGDEDITFYAQWMPIKNTVYYHSPNKTVEVEVYYGDPIIAPEYQGVDNEVIDEWYTDQDCTQVFVFDDAKMGLTDINLYTKFYEVEYYHNGSSWYSTSNTSADAYKEYAQKLANSIEGYNYIYTAITKAVGGDTAEFNVIMLYANCQGNRVYILGQIPGMEAAATPILDFLDAYLPYAQYASFYSQFVQYYLVSQGDPQTLAELCAEHTSAVRAEKAQEFSLLEANAYNPVSTVEGDIFDGWNKQVDTESKKVKLSANYVQKAVAPKNLSISATTNTSAFFTWDKVTGAYGYRVSYSINNSEEQSEQLKGEETIKYELKNLANDDKVKFKVVTLKADENGNYKKETNEYVSTVLTGGSEVRVEKQSLDSNPISLNYVHTGVEEIRSEDLLGFGDYYYKFESGEKTKFVFFTNTPYQFNVDGGISIVSEGNVAQATVEGSTIYTHSLTGKFQFVAGATTYEAEVFALPESTISGPGLSAYELADVTNNAKNKAEYTSKAFLNEGEKEAYNIGTGSPFKFDVDTISTSGKKIINFDKEYVFYLNGEEVDRFTNVINADTESNDDTVKGSIANYNFKTDEFTFLGKNKDKTFTVEIKAKEDIENEKDGYDYINYTIPMAYKDSLAQFTKTFSFKLNDGINVTDDLSMRAAIDNRSATAINIHNNIEASSPANSYIYIGESDRIGGVYDSYYGPAVQGKTRYGDTDIVSGTAVMTTSGDYGPRIWVEVDENSWTCPKCGNSVSGKEHSCGRVLSTDPYKVCDFELFADINGKYYKYDSGYVEGAPNEDKYFAIKSAEFKQNFDGGSFKSINCEDIKDNHINLANVGYRPGSVYVRNYLATAEMTIHGNYHTINASKIPFIRSQNHVDAGTIATYEIQSNNSAILSNVSAKELNVNNLSIIGNTGNTSASLGGDNKTTNVAEIMRQTSGGINGLASYVHDYDVSAHGSLNAYGVNVSNTLIAGYFNAGGSLKYSHLSNSWANGIYAFSNTGRPIIVDHSVIESSGGAAMHVEDQGYSYGINGNPDVTNPTLQIDYSTSTVENFVSGEEQWFKGYSMEVVALGMKTTMDQGVKAAIAPNATILKNIKNPTTGLSSECMNWVFFDKTQGIKDQDTKNAADIGTVLNLGDDYILNPDFSDIASGKLVFVKMTELSGIAMPANLVAESQVKFTGNASLLQLNINPLDFGFIDTTMNLLKNKPIINPIEVATGGTVQFVASYANMPLTIDVTFDAQSGAPIPTVTPLGEATITNQYLYFRQTMAPMGYIQGMCEIFMN